jgi:hypothetical protein
MQKDMHFYLTYTLARKLKIDNADAEKIAWADQYTDDLTEADLHGIQTQSDIVGNWGDRQIQMSVLVPFHFLPGNDSAHPWMTTPNNWRARRLVRAAKSNLLQLGIAIHGLQDTFSHQGFSGWRESLNSCFPWYYVQSTLPNVGHAEMRVVPDVVNYVWTDPRNGKRIDNKRRARSAAKATFGFLAIIAPSNDSQKVWESLSSELQQLFRLDSYDRRVDALCVLSGNKKIDYKEVNVRLERDLKVEFVRAANNHLAYAISLFKGLPRVTEENCSFSLAFSEMK